MPFDNTPIVDTPASLALEAAIKLIERPERWCRDVSQMTLPCGARAYCAWGAARAVLTGLPMGQRSSDALLAHSCAKIVNDALNAAAMRYNYRIIAELNDDARTTHAMVLDVMRDAVDIARGYGTLYI